MEINVSDVSVSFPPFSLSLSPSIFSTSADPSTAIEGNEQGVEVNTLQRPDLVQKESERVICPLKPVPPPVKLL